MSPRCVSSAVVGVESPSIRAAEEKKGRRPSPAYLPPNPGGARPGADAGLPSHFPSSRHPFPLFLYFGLSAGRARRGRRAALMGVGGATPCPGPPGGVGGRDSLLLVTNAPISPFSSASSPQGTEERATCCARVPGGEAEHSGAGGLREEGGGSEGGGQVGEALLAGRSERRRSHGNGAGSPNTAGASGKAGKSEPGPTRRRRLRREGSLFQTAAPGRKSASSVGLWLDTYHRHRRPPNPQPREVGAVAAGARGALLLLTLLLSLLQPGDTLPPLPAGSPGLPGPGPDAFRFREMQKRYKDLVDRLWVNQSWEDSNPDHRTATVLWILTPKLRLGPGGYVNLRISRAVLSAGRPAGPRLHRALLWLSPTAPSPRDVTRPLQRLLASEGPAPRVLRLRLSPPPSDPAQAALPSARGRLELHLRLGAARRRRNKRAPTAEACATGKAHCCSVRSRRVTLEELGWEDWVLAPRELDVRACVGACPPRFRPANAHARIKARLHDLDPGFAPEPCCVPASFEPVVLMHQDSDGRVTLTPYDDILVKDCHCA
ncbi:growth/differentiation factor 15-like [Dugong dugon]